MCPEIATICTVVGHRHPDHQFSDFVRGRVERRGVPALGHPLGHESAKVVVGMLKERADIDLSIELLVYLLTQSGFFARQRQGPGEPVE